MQKSALVLGGGFAGLEAAISLRKQGIDVTLVSNRSYLYMYPTSIWVATGEVGFDSVCLDLESLSQEHRFAFAQGKVEAIHGTERMAVVDGGEMRADFLLVAIGAAKMKPKGVEHTHSICGEPEGATAFREALDRLVAAGGGRIAIGFGGNPKDSSAVRGGPAFELMFNVDTLLRRKGIRDNFELSFFAPMAVPGQRMGTRAVESVARRFSSLNIAPRYGKKIANFDAGGVVLEDGSRIDSDLTMFIPAGDGHPVVKSSNLPQNDAGFIRVNGACEVDGVDGVYAIGDVAALEGPDWRAKQGHIAEVMARTSTNNIAAKIAGREGRESYLPHVNILCMMDTGNGAAYVFRNDRKQTMIPLPVVGHWMKKGWAAYYKASKRGEFPRLPGM